MAKIFRASSEARGIFSENDYDVMEGFVLNYWGAAAAEKVFLIPYWKMKQLLAASTEEEVALKVTDIDNLALVNGEWVVFEEGDDEALADPFRRDDYYFVINEALVEKLRTEALKTAGVQQFAIGGRLAKETTGGATTYFAFFYIFECKPKLPGGGGEGFGTGFRIPPGQ